MTSEGNSALLAANVDRRALLERGLMNFQPYNESLKDLVPQETVNFVRISMFL